MDSQKLLLLQRFNRAGLWAIHPECLSRAMLDLLAHQIEASTSIKPSFAGLKENKVAIIPIQGVLTSDGPSWYGTNYGTISDAAEKAAADPSVKRIVLSVDSPGGEVVGLPETANIIAQAAKIKPVSAMVEGMSASAAYWLTSQASDVTLTPSGEVGSVGVRMMHMDISKMLEDAGVKVTELQAGQFKTEWSPYKPLSDDAKADMQRRLEETHQEFMDAISGGRGSRISQNMRRNSFGGGRVFSAKDALQHGFVDRIESRRNFFRAIAQEPEARPAIGLHAARVAIAKAKF
jgi:signal peptide peptidase SppA